MSVFEGSIAEIEAAAAVGVAVAVEAAVTVGA